MIGTSMKIAFINGLLVRGGAHVSASRREATNIDGMNSVPLCEVFRRTLAENGWRDALTASDAVVASVVEALLSRKQHSALGNTIVNIADVAEVIADTAGMAFEVGFASAKTTFQAISKVATVSKPKSNELRSLTTGSEVEEIPEGQAPKLGMLSPVLDALTLKKYGRALLLTMESILNDRLDILTSAPVAVGASLKRMLNHLAWSHILGNPNTSEDSAPVFSVAHANLMAPAALSAASLAAAYSAMLQFRTGADSNLPGAIVPKYLCVPPALYLTALNLVGADMANAEIIGPRIGVVIEPEISLTLGDNAWLLCADANVLPHTLSVYQTGDLKPTVSVRAGQSAEAKGVFIDICQYFAPLVQNWRGWILNRGA